MSATSHLSPIIAGRFKTEIEISRDDATWSGWCSDMKSADNRIVWVRARLSPGRDDARWASVVAAHHHLPNSGFPQLWNGSSADRPVLVGDVPVGMVPLASLLQVCSFPATLRLISALADRLLSAHRVGLHLPADVDRAFFVQRNGNVFALAHWSVEQNSDASEFVIDQLRSAVDLHANDPLAAWTLRQAEDRRCTGIGKTASVLRSLTEAVLDHRPGSSTLTRREITERWTSLRFAGDHPRRKIWVLGSLLALALALAIALAFQFRTVTVPQVVHAPSAAATQELRGRGLNVKVNSVFSERFVEGAVIRQSLQPDVVVDPGTEVVLTVSAGPEPVPIPDVVGKPAWVAQRDLEAAGFRVDAPSSGIVVGTDPDGRSSAAPGSVVMIRVE